MPGGCLGLLSRINRAEQRGTRRWDDWRWKLALKISVVITSYNYGQFIGAAIDSVLSQTRRADEIIVIDDGSTDGSRALIETYGNRIRAIFQNNEGIPAIW